MTKTAKYAREALVNIVRSRRQGGRCALVKELTDEGKSVSKEFDDLIVKKESNVTKLKSEIDALEEQKSSLLTSNMLHSDNFCKTADGQCRWRQLHPKLDVYDTQTDHCVIELMTRPEVDESTVIELLGESDES